MFLVFAWCRSWQSCGLWWTGFGQTPRCLCPAGSVWRTSTLTSLSSNAGGSLRRCLSSSCQFSFQNVSCWNSCWNLVLLFVEVMWRLISGLDWLGDGLALNLTEMYWVWRALYSQRCTKILLFCVSLLQSFPGQTTSSSCPNNRTDNCYFALRAGQMIHHTAFFISILCRGIPSREARRRRRWWSTGWEEWL